MSDDESDRSNGPNGWPTWAAVLKPRTPATQLSLFDRFAAWMEKNALAIWEGQLNLALENEAHANLRKKLGSTAQSASAELALMDWWDRLIAAGNQSDRWEIPLLPPVVRLAPMRPEFVRKDFLLLHHFRTLEQAFMERLQEPLAPDQLRDAILCSAIVNGGVASRPMLSAIISMDASSVSGHEGELRVTLHIPVGKSEFTEQLWYPDALTSVLITRALKQPGILHAAAGTAPPPVRIHEALDALGLPLFDCGDLLRAAHVAFSLSAPPYIAAYLADELSSQSLPNDVLRHLCGWRHHQVEKPEAPEGDAALSSYGDFIDADFSYDPKAVRSDQVKVINTTIKFLEKKYEHPISKIDQEIQRHGAGLWPVTRLLIEWTKWLLGGNDGSALNFGRKSIRKSSAVRYLRTIGRHLITLVGDENLLEMEAEDFESLYELSAARVIQRSERNVFWARVISFHRFLMLAGAPALDICELDGFEAAGHRQVSANLVGEPDFQTFKQAIKGCADWGPETPHQRILLAAILGYRCGLRRREVQMLLLHDVHPAPDPYLVVRSSEFAQLKSYSSHRRLPLRALLPDDELKLLLDHVEKRKEVLDDVGGLVFSRQGDPRIPLADAELFAPITTAFQAIIGLKTPRFRFHHLRHSFANWLFLALVGIDNPELTKGSSRLINCSPLRKGQLGALSEALFPRLLGTPPAPSRKNLYIVSGLLGHLSPQTTAHSYLHILDWLSGRESDLALSSRLASLGSRQLGALCGLSQSMPHKAPYRDLPANPVAFLRRYVWQQLPGAHSEVVDKRKQAPRHSGLGDIFVGLSNPPPPHPGVLMGVLARLHREVDPERLARCYTLPRSAIESAAEHYQRLYAKQSVTKPKVAMRHAAAPRQVEAAKKFWGILDQTCKTYTNADEETRQAMTVAARLLIHRNGPKTGRVYFGERQETAPQIVRGLIAMGIPVAEMKLEIRTPDSPKEQRPFLDETIAAVEKLGISLDHQRLDWSKREQKATVLRLHLLAAPVTDSLKEKILSSGKINGINYAAIWVMFANEVHVAGHAVTP